MEDSFSTPLRAPRNVEPFPGFDTCGEATCKCNADEVIAGEDAACNAALHDEGRKFDLYKLVKDALLLLRLSIIRVFLT